MPERTTSVEQDWIAASRCARGSRQLRPAFTLIDVLVTMAVIAVLISILSPALTSIRESARQVVCRSNMRQIGIGISLYAQDNKDFIPPSINAPAGQISSASWQTMELKIESTYSPTAVWDGLGILYVEEILPAPKLFYCPSHHGNHPYADYRDSWAGGPGGIVGNYQYRASGLSQRRSTSSPAPRLTTALGQMVPQTALVADGMRTQEDFNHVVGANVLRASLSVDWWHDPGTFAENLPKDGQTLSGEGIEHAWESLDLMPTH